MTSEDQQQLITESVIPEDACRTRDPVSKENKVSSGLWSIMLRFNHNPVDVVMILDVNLTRAMLCFLHLFFVALNN